MTNIFLLFILSLPLSAHGGFTFEAQCLKDIPDIEAQFQRANEEGIACLERLAKDGNGARTNLALYKNFIANTKVKAICSNETWFLKNDSIARAVLEKSEILLRSKWKWRPNELAETVFHEQFHFLGFEHGYTIDYTGACAECCFGIKKDLGYKYKTACQICSGNYDGLADPKYAGDFLQFINLSFQEPHRHFVDLFARMALIEKPASDEHLWLMSYYARQFDPVTILWSKKLLGEKIVSSDRWKSRAAIFLAPESAPVIPLVNQVIDFMFEFYVRGDIDKAVAAYLKIDPAIMKGIMQKSQTDFYHWWLLREIQNHLYADDKALTKVLEKQSKKQQLASTKKHYQSFRQWWHAR